MRNFPFLKGSSKKKKEKSGSAKSASAPKSSRHSSDKMVSVVLHVPPDDLFYVVYAYALYWVVSADRNVDQAKI